MEKALKIIGISVETTNENGQSAVDLGNLFGRFFSENILEKIPQKISSNLYCIYTDYQSDYRGKYTTLLGCEVSTLTEIPAGMVGREFPSQPFKKFVAHGEMPVALQKIWQEIWQNDTQLNRSYTYDYDFYSEKSQNGEASEVEVFIGVNEK